MGTNYYHRKNICPKCGRYDEEHIGKSSCGWQFSFHGTNEIRSYKDWMIELKKGEIFNEYDEKISLDELMKMIESKRGGKNHYDECIGKYDMRNGWKDEEGNSFSPEDFF